MGRYDRYGYGYGYAPYVSVAEKRARNKKAADKLRKKDENVRPVVVQGRTIATSWWGKSWNANLERYADYSNRIGRGRSYVCHGAVLDLGVVPGRVDALVQGSRGSPYKVTITIEALSAGVWKQLREESLKQVDSLSDLLAGKFPKALKNTFFAQGTGLFPSPKEINFDCSCPDWASMCKHVAAALYGIGNRLDSSPELLFTLRRVTMDELIAHTIDAAAQGLIGRADRAAGDDVLADADLGDVFGIEMENVDLGAIDLPSPTKPATKRATSAKPAAKPATKRATAAKPATKRATAAKPAAKPATKRATAAKRTVVQGAPEHGRMVEQFMEAVALTESSFRAGDMGKLLPDWSRLQVSNTLQRAVKEGLIKRVRSGVFQQA